MILDDRLLTSVADLDPNPFASVSFSLIRNREPFLSVPGSGSVSYSNEHNKINWKGKFNKKCPSGWFLADLLTSVSDPDPVGSAFNLGLNPGSGSIFGIRIRIRIPDPDF
jgi:hypothetical protein